MTLCLTVVCGLVWVALLFVCVFQHLFGTSRLVDFSKGNDRNARGWEETWVASKDLGSGWYFHLSILDQSKDVCVLSRSVMSKSLWPHGLYPARLLSMGFPKQDYWSGLPFPSPGDLSEPRMELSTLVSPALTGGFFTTAEGCGQVQSQGINSTPSEAMARVWRKQGVKNPPPPKFIIVNFVNYST